MIIRNLYISNFGGLSEFEEDLSSGITRICSPFGAQISGALALLLCYQDRSFPKSWLRSSTRISACVLLQGQNLQVELNGKQQLLVTDEAGNNMTRQYQYTLAHSQEQDDIEQFDGRNKHFPQLLYRYRNQELQALADRTNGIADTPSFRRHLWQFVHSFQPEPIHNAKRYQLNLLPDGRFFPSLPGYSGPVRLSETEEKLFRYLCYLNIAEFWSRMEGIRNLHQVKKPLLIRNFLEFLDESTDIENLLSRTAKLGRQIIMLTIS